MLLERDYEVGGFDHIIAYERADGDPHSDSEIRINVNFDATDPDELDKFLDRQCAKLGGHRTTAQSGAFGAISYRI